LKKKRLQESRDKIRTIKKMRAKGVSPYTRNTHGTDRSCKRGHDWGVDKTKLDRMNEAKKVKGPQNVADLLETSRAWGRKGAGRKKTRDLVQEKGVFYGLFKIGVGKRACEETKWEEEN